MFAYIIVHCPPLTNPNGLYRCNLGSDGVISYEDICNLECNTGYEVIGSDTRTCQSDGNWSDSDDVCRRGTYVIEFDKTRLPHTSNFLTVTYYNLT